MVVRKRHGSLLTSIISITNCISAEKLSLTESL